jgi:hypothetical protein
MCRVRKPYRELGLGKGKNRDNDQDDDNDHRQYNSRLGVIAAKFFAGFRRLGSTGSRGDGELASGRGGVWCS